MSGFFEITTEYLKSLDQKQALLLFRDVLWAEALRIGISQALVHIPECINTPDGGIDAELKDIKSVDGSWIESGTTGFQIKAGDLTPSDCKKELHEGSDLSRGIKPKVKKLLDAGGKYIVVSFASLSGTQRDDRLNALKDELDKYGIPSDKVDFYDAAHIKGFIERYPSLVICCKRFEPACCKDFRIWSQGRCIKTPKSFILDEQREKMIEDLRGRIRVRDGKVNLIRVSGVAGIGKTRFAHELLNVEDLRSQVIYIEDISEAGSFLNAIESDEHLSGIVVIDDVDKRKYRSLEDRFADLENRDLTIITLSTDCTPSGRPTIFERLNGLSDEKMKQLLAQESPGLKGPIVDQIVRFADGYPRFAILLSEQCKGADTEKDAFSLGTTERDLFEKLIAGEHAHGSEGFNRTKTALMWISLFAKVGYKGPVQREVDWLIEKSGLSRMDFNSVIREQKGRGLIQGVSYISITPVILAIWLLKEWWEIYGFDDADSFRHLVESIPEDIRPKMLVHMGDNLRFIGASEVGVRLASELLKPGGVVSELISINPSLGETFFLNLTEANPDAALRYLKSIIDSKTDNELLGDHVRRRMMIWGLEKILIRKHLFNDAIALLLRLAVSENEACGNNATGTFVSMFSPIYAPTEKSYFERLEILKQVMNSDRSEEVKIGIDACSHVFSDSIVRVYGSELQGLKKSPVLSTPQTRGERMEVYKTCWALLFKVFESTQDQELKGRALKALLDNCYMVLRYEETAPTALTDLEKIAQIDAFKRSLLSKILFISSHWIERFDPQVAGRLNSIAESIVNESYEGKLERYVGMDFSEDAYNKRMGLEKASDDKLVEIAKEMIQDTSLFESHKDWLRSDKARKGFRLGWLLASYDNDLVYATKIVALIEGADDLMFVCGYLSFLFENKKDIWQKLMNDIYLTKELANKLPEIVFRSGVDDWSFDLVLNAINNGLVSVRSLWVFIYGLSLFNISEDLFLVWIRAMLSLNQKEATVIAMATHDYYYLHKEEGVARKLPSGETFDLITHKTLFDEVAPGQEQMEGFYWKELADRYVLDFPEAREALAKKIIESLDRDNTFLANNEKDVLSVLCKLAKYNPKGIWKMISGALGPPIDRRAFILSDWLKGGIGFRCDENGSGLDVIDPEDFWKWVGEDIENRAWYAATLVPKDLFHDLGKYCWARELLVRYGDREDVRRNLNANYFTEGWSGPASLHYTNKKKHLEVYRTEESDKNVLRWVDDQIQTLNEQIKHALLEEEERGF